VSEWGVWACKRLIDSRGCLRQFPPGSSFAVSTKINKLHSLTITSLMFLVESNLLCSLSFDLTAKVSDPLTGYAAPCRPCCCHPPLLTYVVRRGGVTALQQEGTCSGEQPP
jgi:hypothetical protein